MRNYTYLALTALSMACSSNIVVGVGDGDTSDGGDGDSSMVITCGDAVCAAGSICCEGCPGDTPTCSPAGAGCAAISCQNTCGSEVCGEGENCCRTGCGTDDVICADECPTNDVECPPRVICNGELCEGSAPACCPGCEGDAPVCAPDGVCPTPDCTPTCDPTFVTDEQAACLGFNSPACTSCHTLEGRFAVSVPGVPPPRAIPTTPLEDCGVVRSSNPCSRCDAMDVRLVGGCEPAPVWWFDGERCTSGAGCECVGAACERAYASEADCLADFASCGSGCGAMDAAGIGFCDLELGIMWDGTRCRSISGCECDGADCGRLFMDTASCERAFSSCASCGPTDARGVGPCRAILGVVWDGTDCRAISGCECEGSECDSLYSSTDACRADRAACL